MKLHELGEFELISSILIKRAYPLGGLVGTDCARVSIPNDHDLIISSDKGNRPLAWTLPGATESYNEMGWLTAIAGISDLATEGAKPLCATNNIIAHREFEVRSLEEFVDGFCSALRSYGFRHAGGDLSEGEKFSTSATFIGIKKKNTNPSTRFPSSGLVYVLGELGTFAASYLKAKRKGIESLSEDQRDILRAPKVPLEIMQSLSERGILLDAADASDGVNMALELLAKRKKVNIEVNLDKISYDKIVEEECEINRIQTDILGFSWGNWQQLVLVREDDRKSFERLCASSPFQCIGTFGSDGAAVRYWKGGRHVEVTHRNNEAFTAHSYVTKSDLPFL